jgi:hypothetical protein
MGDAPPTEATSVYEAADAGCDLHSDRDRQAQRRRSAGVAGGRPRACRIIRRNALPTSCPGIGLRKISPLKLLDRVARYFGLDPPRGLHRMRMEIGDIVDVLEPFENWNQTDTTEAVRDLRRTAFSSRCRPIAGSPRRRLVDRELSPKPVSFDRLGRVPAREQIVHCLIPTGERKP